MVRPHVLQRAENAGGDRGAGTRLEAALQRNRWPSAHGLVRACAGGSRKPAAVVGVEQLVGGRTGKAVVKEEDVLLVAQVHDARLREQLGLQILGLHSAARRRRWRRRRWRRRLNLADRMRGTCGEVRDGRVQGADEATGFPEEANVACNWSDCRGVEWRRGVGRRLRAGDILVEEGPVAAQAEQTAVGRWWGLARRVRRRWRLYDKDLLCEATVANAAETVVANGCCHLCNCVGERHLHLRDIRLTKHGPDDCDLVADSCQ